MGLTKDSLLEKLREWGIECETISHALSPTCPEHSENIKGTTFEKYIGKGQAKNLFFKVPSSGGKLKNRLFLVCALTDTDVDNKVLSARMGIKASAPLRLAPEDAYLSTLQVPVGSATPFAMANSSTEEVILLLDERFKDCELLLFHPMQSDFTTGLSPKQLENFLERCCASRYLYVDLAAQSSIAVPEASAAKPTAAKNESKDEGTKKPKPSSSGASEAPLQAGFNKAGGGGHTSAQATTIASAYKLPVGIYRDLDMSVRYYCGRPWDHSDLPKAFWWEEAADVSARLQAKDERAANTGRVAADASSNSIGAALAATRAPLDAAAAGCLTASAAADATASFGGSSDAPSGSREQIIERLRTAKSLCLDPVTRCDALLRVCHICVEKLEHIPVVASEGQTSNEHHHVVLQGRAEGHIVVSLFLKGKKKKSLCLVVRKPSTKPDMKTLGSKLAEAGLPDKEYRLADEDSMLECLGVGRDFASPLALLDDVNGSSGLVVFDDALDDGKLLWCLPPGLNNASWGVSLSDCEKYAAACGAQTVRMTLA